MLTMHTETRTQRSVHGVAHDSREESTTTADQRSHHGQQGLVQDKTLRTQGPTCLVWTTIAQMGKK